VGVVAGGEEFKGETAASADLSHFVFSSDAIFAPEAAPGDVYDNDTTDGSVAVVSRAENGDDLAVKPLKASEHGSHILMTTGTGLCRGILFSAPSCGPGQLYMRVDDAVTYAIAPGHAVRYLGMTADGTKVFFTSNEQLNGEDTDTSSDLYMWSEEAPSAVTLVSKGNQGPVGPGNSDSCSVSWTTKCGVVPIKFVNPDYVSEGGGEGSGGYATLQGDVGGNGVSDSYIASESGDVFFYSPELLDGERGIRGAENLYDYRGGQLQLVAPLSPEGKVCTEDQGVDVCSQGAVARVDVSPDGTHMAFITASKVTAYENSGHAEMYSYEPEAALGRQIVCDSCNPTGKPPTSDVFGAQNGLFMTNSGRAFFSTNEALVPQDTNRAEDIYEFAEGRPQLISSGTGAPNNSFGFIGLETFPGLIGVSADGTNVYFSTYESLVGQDQNGEELKIYDARSNGGFAFVKAPPGCAAADECHGAGRSSPPSPAPGTAAPLREGNSNPKKAHGKPRRHRGRHRRKRGARTHHGDHAGSRAEMGGHQAGGSR
jgi:hypothetical protein